MNGMISSPADSWRALFAPGAERRNVIIVRKHQQPLLVLSGKRGALSEGMGLYPAQSFLAKCARNVLRLGLRYGLPLPLEREELPVDSADSFWQFLTVQAGGTPDFALLCGNPKASGRRFTLLVSNGQTRRVVKVGISKQAQDLILQEERFLQALGKTVQAPRVLDAIHRDNLAAFATDYIRGDSPSLHCVEQAASVLASWIQPGEVPLEEIPAWKRLMQATSATGCAFQDLANRRVSPMVFHGDFAPWNIKVTPQGWVALDWERGEPLGVPGWDWFHFVIQPRVLVLGMSPNRVVQTLETMIPSPFFQRYACQARIQGIERRLALAYLEYMLHVTPPSDGAARLAAVHERALNRWL